MTIYINETTNEYPRFTGDVALQPEANWAIVTETPCPDISEANSGMHWVEGTPEKINGSWFQTWRMEPFLEEMQIPILHNNFFNSELNDPTV